MKTTQAPGIQPILFSIIDLKITTLFQVDEKLKFKERCTKANFACLFYSINK
jgi:hypothetical protein